MSDPPPATPANPATPGNTPATPNQSQPLFMNPYTVEQGRTRAAGLFWKTFGVEPDGVFRAPGRVNVIG